MNQYLYWGKKCVIMGATMLASVLTTTSVFAQPFPNKPVKIIVTAAPGGTTDIASRALSDVLGKELGQSVIVENKAGGAGIIGIQALLAAPADGYTMAMGNIGPNAINYSLYKNLPYKMEDMEPITIVIANDRRISASSRRLAGSRFDDGSSRTRISGFIASTVATATLRRCPNER
ncbi:MAG: hypothetical protein RJB15_1575 [Pseudomonadota bacterium]